MKSFIAGLLSGGLSLGLIVLHTEAQQTEVPLNVESGSPFAAEIVSTLLEDSFNLGPIEIRNPVWPGIYQLPDSNSTGMEIRIVTEDTYYTCEKATPFFANRMIRRRELSNEDVRQ